MSNEKDKISRKAFIDLDTKFLSKLLRMDVVKTETVPSRVRQTIEERESDIILIIHTRSGYKFILHLEFQGSNDSKMVMRMAIYDYILHEEHRLDVLGVVIYLGKDGLNMKNKIIFFNTHYSCPIFDIRDLDPQLFMNSNHPRQVIFAVLAGPDSDDKANIIQKILIKLQELLPDSDISFRECIIEMAHLAQATSEHVQHQIQKEVQKMAITFPIENNIFFRETAEKLKKKFKIEGKREGKIENAETMLKDGMKVELVYKYTGLPVSRLKQLQKEILSK